MVPSVPPCMLIVLAALAVAPDLSFAEIPHWARKYDVSCAQCHVSVPRLNQFGEEFLANGYKPPPGSNLRSVTTLPLAVWLSGRADSRPPGVSTGDRIRSYLNRVEIISGGELVAPWMSYFVEWRPVSYELRGDGTLRDRSGRFEDIFATASRGAGSLAVGQFRMLSQVDVSRRLGISEPLVFSASLPGGGGGAPTARQRSLRAFAPGARSPAVRGGWQQAAGGWDWISLAALPLPGEFSIPLTSEARVEASNEMEWRLKGIFAESFLRSGPTSVGGHVFVDDSRRYLAQAVVTARSQEAFYWTAAAGAAKSGTLLAGRWSAEGEYIPSQFLGLGMRVEDRAADGARVAVLPYLNASFPATKHTVRLTLERRVQRGRHGTFLELGAVF